MMDTFLSAVSKRHTMGRLLLMAMAEQSLDIGQIMRTCGPQLLHFRAVSG
jgi:hypothetical protein